MRGLRARLLLDLGRVEQRAHNRGRADSDRDARPDEFRAPLIVRVVPVVSHASLLAVPSMKASG